MKELIVCGNAIDGLTFVGPFDDHEEAREYAEASLKNEEWVITSMLSPEEEK